ncbi:MAG TPA: S-4TM family putative pore-forming effector [Acholeplasmataceae bacterium]|nr:S-4TM family putative pore-forming effector [Acholeplasmataceae bacterium]
MNNIFEHQNIPENQQLIVAQHYVYKKAKQLSLLLFILSVIIPLIFNITKIWITNEIVAAIFSFVSICFLIASKIINSIINKEKSLAAQIQQKFDINVFELNNINCLNNEKIYVVAEKYKYKDWHRKKDWYPDYQELDKNKAIFYCQQQNLEWTNNLSRKYMMFLTVCVILMAAAVTLNFIIENKTMIHIISTIVIALPLITYYLVGFIKMIEDNQSLTEIRKYSNEIEILFKNKIIVNLFMLENLQWMIFYYRKSKYLIPEWFDRIFYKNISNMEQKKVFHRKTDNNI